MTINRSKQQRRSKILGQLSRQVVHHLQLKNHFGMFPSFYTNEFCQKNGWPCRDFLINWLNMLNLNWSHEFDLSCTWASLIKKVYRIWILLHCWRTQEIERFIANRSLAILHGIVKFNTFRLTDDFHLPLCCSLWFIQIIKKSKFVIISCNWYNVS
jgi:hypothetical protein